MRESCSGECGTTPITNFIETEEDVLEPGQTAQIQVPENDGKTSRRTMKHRQFPVTPAYAFTDYRSQGQTIPHVIVDIASPPTRGLSLFNLYVALS